MDEKAIPCVLVGYSARSKGYLVLHQATGKVFVSSIGNTAFNETSRPLQVDGGQGRQLGLEHGLESKPTGEFDDDRLRLGRTGDENHMNHQVGHGVGMHGVGGDVPGVLGGGVSGDDDRQIEVGGEDVDGGVELEELEIIPDLESDYPPALERPPLRPPAYPPEFAGAAGSGRRRVAGSRLPLSDGKILFLQENPKTVGTACYGRYESYKAATTVAEARRLGASTADLRWDRERGYLEQMPTQRDDRDVEAKDEGDEVISAHLAMLRRISGEQETEYPDVPQVDGDASVRRGLTAKLAAPLKKGDLDKIRRRIGILELAAEAPPDFLPQAPRSFREAMGSINRRAWIRAMDEEIAAMESFGVWQLVHPPPGANIMGCRWVFALKRDADGKIDRLKARLVAKGFTQRKGVDFVDTWAPTPVMRCFRMMMAQASSDPGIRTAAWDCTSAFLHARTDHEVFMSQPEGYEAPDEDGEGPPRVCKLFRAIYGMKQSARLFHLKVKSALEAMGAVQGKADDCFYQVTEGGGWMKMLVHVDDIAVTYNDRGLYDKVFATFAKEFKVTDYGARPIRKFLGVCVEKQPDGSYRLHQRPYIEELLGRLNVREGQTAKSPEKPGTKAKLRPVTEWRPGEERFMSEVPYREAVCALFYIARMTRPDIAHACSQVARFMNKPGMDHWVAVQRIYRYLNGTKDKALVMRSKGMGCEVGAFMDAMSDSDWLGEPDTRLSHTGYVVRVGGSTVSWSSKRQMVHAQSTTEAEYIAAATTANELIWWRRLMDDFSYINDGPVTIYCDNSAAALLADHESKFDRTKHIQLRYHLLRDYQRRGSIRVQWCPAEDMVADCLTKNPSVKHFRRMAGRMLGEEL